MSKVKCQKAKVDAGQSEWKVLKYRRKAAKSATRRSGRGFLEVVGLAGGNLYFFGGDCRFAIALND
jgi:hypothetical protein